MRWLTRYQGSCALDFSTVRRDTPARAQPQTPHRVARPTAHRAQGSLHATRSRPPLIKVVAGTAGPGALGRLLHNASMPRHQRPKLSLPLRLSVHVCCLLSGCSWLVGRILFGLSRVVVRVASRRPCALALVSGLSWRACSRGRVVTRWRALGAWGRDRTLQCTPSRSMRGRLSLRRGIPR